MSYIVTLPDSDQPNAFEDFTEAREFAQAQAQEQTIEVEVIHEPTGAVAFVATHVVGRFFNPWERVETPTFQAPHLEGWRPAYTRKKIQATVYRCLSERKWLVHDGRTGGTQEVANTTEARQLTSSMRHGFMIPNPDAEEVLAEA